MASTSNLSTDISVLIQEYYERMALKERVFDNGLLKYAKRGRVPKNNSKVAHYHKWSKFALAGDVAENADPATGIAADASEVIAAMTEFASYIDIPNFGDAVRIDSLIKESYPKFIEQAERSANRRLIRSIGEGDAADTNASSSYSAFPVLYAGGADATFATMTAARTPITNKDIQRAVARLEQQGAPKINGQYICLLNPWSKADLFINDADFRDFFKLNNDALVKGELRMWAGALIGYQDEPYRESLATENTYDGTGPVVSSYVFGRDAFGITQLFGKEGVKPKFKVQDITKTGAVTSIGYRIPFSAIVLDTTFGVTIKSVTADASIASAS